MTRNLMYCFMSIFVMRPRLWPAAPTAVGSQSLQWAANEWTFFWKMFDHPNYGFLLRAAKYFVSIYPLSKFVPKIPFSGRVPGLAIGRNRSRAGGACPYKHGSNTALLITESAQRYVNYRHGTEFISHGTENHGMHAG